MAKNEVTPIDGDKDNIVLENTPAERAVDGSHLVAEQDTYASLGEFYKSGKQSGFEKASDIYALNSGKPLLAGEAVRII